MYWLQIPPNLSFISSKKLSSDSTDISADVNVNVNIFMLYLPKQLPASPDSYNTVTTAFS